MEVIHFYPNYPKLEFFKGCPMILDDMIDDTIYCRFSHHGPFLEYLDERCNNSDINIITAHGGHNSIIELGFADEGNTKIITTDDSEKFRNNMVFSFSCDTAKTLGPSMIDKGTIAFIGFYSRFSPNFNFEGHYGNKFSDSMELLGKKIFVYAFSKLVGLFVNKPFTAVEFTELLDIAIHKTLDEVEKKDTPELLTRFGIDVTPRLYDMNKELVFVNLHEMFNKAYDCIDLLGDENYISYKFLCNLDEKILRRMLDEFTMEYSCNRYYEYYIKLCIARIINDDTLQNEYEKFLNLELLDKGIDFQYD